MSRGAPQKFPCADEEVPSAVPTTVLLLDQALPLVPTAGAGPGRPPAAARPGSAHCFSGCPDSPGPPGPKGPPSTRLHLGWAGSVSLLLCVRLRPQQHCLVLLKSCHHRPQGPSEPLPGPAGRGRGHRCAPAQEATGSHRPARTEPSAPGRRWA